MELVDRFDNKRIPLNKVTERYDKVEGEFRQSVHLWIENEKGEFLIQKRSLTKKVFPGVWSITGGAVDSGETPLVAVKRECNEELGIEINEDNLSLIMSYRREFDFVDVYWLKQNIELENVVMQPEEVIDVAWVTKNKIKKMLATKEITPSLNIYYDTMLNIYDYYILNGGKKFDIHGNEIKSN